MSIFGEWFTAVSEAKDNGTYVLEKFALVSMSWKFSTPTQKQRLLKGVAAAKEHAAKSRATLRACNAQEWAKWVKPRQKVFHPRRGAGTNAVPTFQWEKQAMWEHHDRSDTPLSQNKI